MAARKEKSSLAGDDPRDAVALIQGASRGIGLHMTKAVLKDAGYGHVVATCRNPDAAPNLLQLKASNAKLRILQLDVLDTSTIASAAAALAADIDRVDLLINCSGILHEDGQLWPEKRLADVDAEAITKSFTINALGPLLVAREFEPLLRASSSARFVALSARVGSIGDNRKGGWYAYRSSKAALNMMLRTLAIEWSRLPRQIDCFALHPGTVATELSRPFRRRMSSANVFAPDEAAEKLLATIQELGSEQSGGFFAYDGKPIDW